jgi:hypothetical protein
MQTKSSGYDKVSCDGIRHVFNARLSVDRNSQATHIRHLCSGQPNIDGQSRPEMTSINHGMQPYPPTEKKADAS